MKKYFSSIIWPSRKRTKKEFWIVAIGTAIVALFTFGIDMLAKYLMNIIF